MEIIRILQTNKIQDTARRMLTYSDAAFTGLFDQQIRELI